MSDDVLITPASRKIEFKDNSGNVDGKIELDSSGNLNITSPGGDIGLGDATADVYIGDGTNNVDIVFEQNGEIRGLTGRTLTLGQSDSNVDVAAQNFTVKADTDASAEIGRAHIGYMGFSDYAGFSHVDANGTNTYALLHHPSGYTYLNAASGADIFFRINNSNIMQMDETGLDITGNIAISGSLTADGLAYPTSDGSNGQLLKTNGSGTLSFVDAPSGGGFEPDSTTKNLSAGLRANDGSLATANSAVHNIAIGQDANGGSTNYGGYSVAIGYEALKVNEDNYEVAIGYQAMVARTSTFVFPCAAVGNMAGSRITTGSANAYFGPYNYGCTTGSSNTGVGSFNHTAMTSGNSNTALGDGAGRVITTGDDNITIGQDAGGKITTGDDNICIGDDAAEKLETGSNNIAIGREALHLPTDVSDNIAIGRDSMGGNSGVGNNNVGVGLFSGQSLESSSANNTFIGSNAGSAVSSGEKNTILGGYNGNENSLDIRTTDNNIVLSDGDGNPRLYYTNADTSWKSAEIYATTSGDSANMVSLSSGIIARSTSALKYKQDIRDLEEMNIGLLRPVRYKSKCATDDQNKDHLGIIADEAASSGFEELVTYGADNEIEGFQYERLTVVLLKKIQVLEARIATLESK